MKQALSIIMDNSYFLDEGIIKTLIFQLKRILYVQKRADTKHSPDKVTSLIIILHFVAFLNILVTLYLFMRMHIVLYQYKRIF